MSSPPEWPPLNVRHFDPFAFFGETLDQIDLGLQFFRPRLTFVITDLKPPLRSVKRDAIAFDRHRRV